MSAKRKAPRQQQMWTAIRQLGAFTVDELRVAASTDDLVLTRSTVAYFVTLLLKAGVLIAVHRVTKRAAGIYRLRPSLNTGPNAPKLVKGVLHDGNRGTPIADAAERRAA